MSTVTSSSMYDAQDAEDRRLLAANNHKQLVANYAGQISERCSVGIRDQFAADDVTQKIGLRLLEELARGMHRGPIPFRVIVWKVTDWEIAGHHKPRRQPELPVEEWDTLGPDSITEWEEQHGLYQLAATLPGRQRQVFELVYCRGMTSGEAAAELGIKPNAAYQALSNAHKALATAIRDW